MNPLAAVERQREPVARLRHETAGAALTGAGDTGGVLTCAAAVGGVAGFATTGAAGGAAAIAGLASTGGPTGGFATTGPVGRFRGNCRSLLWRRCYNGRSLPRLWNNFARSWPGSLYWSGRREPGGQAGLGATLAANGGTTGATVATGFATGGCGAGRLAASASSSLRCWNSLQYITRL